MANEKDDFIKNPELLNPNKDTQQERLARGSQRTPKEGQGWADINQKGSRQDIEKQGMIYEGNKEENSPAKPDNSHPQNQTPNKGKAFWDAHKQAADNKDKPLTINHDKEVQERIQNQEKTIDLSKDGSPNKDASKTITEPNHDKDK